LLKRENIPLEFIAEDTGLSIKELEKLKKRINND